MADLDVHASDRRPDDLVAGLGKCSPNQLTNEPDLRFLWEATITEPHIGPAARRASFFGRIGDEHLKQSQARANRADSQTLVFRVTFFGEGCRQCPRARH